MVFRLLQEMLVDTPHLSSIKPFQRTRDGRGAFLALQRHNMGDSKWDKVIEDAETMVQSRIWNGKNAHFPLKVHINKHQEAHNDFIRASQHTDYDPLGMSTLGCHICSRVLHPVFKELLPPRQPSSRTLSSEMILS